MMSFTASLSIWDTFAALFAAPAKATRKAPPAILSDEDRKAYEDILSDMVLSNPCAACSDLGAHYLMSTFHGHR